MSTRDHGAEAVRDVRPVAEPAKTVPSAHLFDGSREIAIAHEGAIYRLRITRQGKLILTK